MNRIESIKKYKALADLENEKKTLAEKEKNLVLELRILELEQRITELIETANACLENGIEINTYRNKGFWHCDDTWDKGTFCTNGITHKIGFVWEYEDQRFIGKIRYMGIDGGGANGPYCLRTDGCKVFDLSGRLDPHQLKQFLDSFDSFEMAFYNYVDDIVK